MKIQTSDMKTSFRIFNTRKFFNLLLPQRLFQRCRIISLYMYNIKFYILMFYFKSIFLRSLLSAFLHIPSSFKFCILFFLSSLLYISNLFLCAHILSLCYTRPLFIIKIYPHIIIEIINPITPYLRIINVVIINTLKKKKEICTRTDSDDFPTHHGGRACK